MSEMGSVDTARAPDDHRLQSLQRLMASRARLRAVLIPQGRYAGSGTPSGAHGDLPGRARALWRLVVSRSSGGAIFSTAASLLRSWWVRQPWHTTTELLGHAVVGEVSPWVRRNPITAIALGACAGAAVAALRPWRWRALRSQTRVMGKSVGRWAVHQLTQVPMQMALAAAVAAWLEQRQSPRESPHESPPNDLSQHTEAASGPGVHPERNPAGSAGHG